MRRTLNMNVDGNRSRVKPMKRWMNCVEDDMDKKGVSIKMTDRQERKNKTCWVHVLVG